MPPENAALRQIRLRLQGIQRTLLAQNGVADLDQLDQLLSTLRTNFVRLGVSDWALLRQIDEASQQVQAQRDQIDPITTEPVVRRNNQINAERLKYLLDLAFTVRRIAPTPSKSTYSTKRSHQRVPISAW